MIRRVAERAETPLLQLVRRTDSAWTEKSSASSSPRNKDDASLKNDLLASDKHGDLKYLWREIETMKVSRRVGGPVHGPLP